jgi:hypothetical protein
MISDRTMGIFMYFNLAKQANEWLFAVEDMPNKYMMNKLREAKKANEKLMAGIEKELGKHGDEYLEKFWDDSEMFSEILGTIRKAESNDKRNDIIMILRAYTKGELQIKEA